MRDNANKLFAEELKNKKLLVRGARNKATPGKKVNLSSDFLTPAQRKRLDGPVITYRMRPGVPAEDLVNWPEDLRKEYIERFGGGDAGGET